MPPLICLLSLEPAMHCLSSRSFMPTGSRARQEHRNNWQIILYPCSIASFATYPDLWQMLRRHFSCWSRTWLRRIQWRNSDWQDPRWDYKGRAAINAHKAGWHFRADPGKVFICLPGFIQIAIEMADAGEIVTLAD